MDGVSSTTGTGRPGPVEKKKRESVSDVEMGNRRVSSSPPPGVAAAKAAQAATPGLTPTIEKPKTHRWSLQHFSDTAKGFKTVPAKVWAFLFGRRSDKKSAEQVEGKQKEVTGSGFSLYKELMQIKDKAEKGDRVGMFVFADLAKVREKFHRHRSEISVDYAKIIEEKLTEIGLPLLKERIGAIEARTKSFSEKPGELHELQPDVQEAFALLRDKIRASKNPEELAECEKLYKQLKDVVDKKYPDFIMGEITEAAATYLERHSAMLEAAAGVQMAIVDKESELIDQAQAQKTPAPGKEDKNKPVPSASVQKHPASAPAVGKKSEEKTPTPHTDSLAQLVEGLKDGKHKWAVKEGKIIIVDRSFMTAAGIGKPGTSDQSKRAAEVFFSLAEKALQEASSNPEALKKLIENLEILGKNDWFKSVVPKESNKLGNIKQRATLWLEMAEKEKPTTSPIEDVLKWKEYSLLAERELEDATKALEDAQAKLAQAKEIGEDVEKAQKNVYAKAKEEETARFNKNFNDTRLAEAEAAADRYLKTSFDEAEKIVSEWALTAPSDETPPAHIAAAIEFHDLYADFKRVREVAKAQRGPEVTKAQVERAATKFIKLRAPLPKA